MNKITSARHKLVAVLVAASIAGTALAGTAHAATTTNSQSSFQVTPETAHLYGTGQFAPNSSASTNTLNESGANQYTFGPRDQSMQLGMASTPPLTVPTPLSFAGVDTSNPSSESGFQGISHRDQRLADGGNQFSLEPPDQGLCEGNTSSGNFVVEAVNDAARVYSPNGTPLTATTSLNQFFLEGHAINRSTGQRGEFMTDPRCYFDPATQRFFLVSLGLSPDYTSSNQYVAVSQTSSALGKWNLYKFDESEGAGADPNSHPSCPCFGDQPLIGADTNGFYVSSNEFPLQTYGFNGAQIYALSKNAMVAGAPVIYMFHYGNLFKSNTEGYYYSVEPASQPQVPTPQDQVLAHNGTEYFLSSADFNGTLDNRIFAWAMTNTARLRANNNSLAYAPTLPNPVELQSETYASPYPAVQKAGPTPLSNFDCQNYGDCGEAENRLASDDDRMLQVVYAHGKLYSDLNSEVNDGTGGHHTASAYFVVAPYFDASGNFTPQITKQGYVAVKGENVLYGAIGVNENGIGSMVFTLVGPDYYPSAAYVPFTAATGATGPVHIAAAGTGPADGFTGYPTYGGNGVERWGDYSAAFASTDGTIWMATEYIPGGPRTTLANWGTYIVHYGPSM